MRMFVALIGRSFARHRAILLGTTCVLSGFQVVLVLVGLSVQREGLFSRVAALVPPFVQEALGGAVVLSFVGFVSLGFFHPVVMLVLANVAIYLASEPAADVEEGLVDIVAARPVPRAVLLARSAVVCGLATAAVVAMMLVANRAAVAWLAPPGIPSPATAGLLKLAANLLVVTWCFGAGALATAAYARKRSTAAGSIGLTAVVLYLLHFAAASWAPARPFDRISPFHYYAGLPILLGVKDPWVDIVTLVAATATLTGWAHIAYARRDL